MNDIFWVYNPLILINSKSAKEIFPLSDMRENEKLNALTRMIILLSILSYIVTKSIYSVISGIISIIIIVAYHKKTEGFESNETDNIVGESAYINENNDVKCFPTVPTKENPMMNVMLTDIKNNPTRCSAEASYNNNVQEKLNDIIKSNSIENVQDERLFKNTYDEMQFDHSMRNFYTTPNTEIPNGQKKFAEWCYGNMPSRKDGTNLEQNLI